MRHRRIRTLVAGVIFNVRIWPRSACASRPSVSVSIRFGHRVDRVAVFPKHVSEPMVQVVEALSQGAAGLLGQETITG
jgi:hypothetical protein